MRVRIGVIKNSMVLMLILSVSVSAGDAGRESPFSNGAGARSVGLGGAFTALSYDASAIYYNPAGLGSLSFQEASFNHTLLVANSTYSFASWAYPISHRQGIAIGFMRLGTGEIARTSGFVRQGEFSFTQSQLVVSYGNRLLDNVSVGASIKLVHSSLDNFSDNGFGFDLGLAAKLYNGLSFGLIARDILSAKLRLNEVSEETSTSITAGFAYSGFNMGEGMLGTMSLDVEKVDGRSSKIHSGVEILWDSTYALRIGYDKNNFVFGAGIRYGKMNFDYAYKIVEYLADNHHLGMSILLGEKVVAPEITEPFVPIPIDDEEIQFRSLRSKADNFFHHFDLDSAMTYYNKALAFDEHNQEIIGILATLERAIAVLRDQERKLQMVEAERRQASNTFYRQAQEFYLKKLYAAANDLLELVLDIEPEHKRARSLKRTISDDIDKEIIYNEGIARNALAKGRIAEGIEAYNRILELDSNNVTIIEAKEKALANLDMAQQLNVGIELFDKGRLQEAARRFMAILKINPDEKQARDYLRRIREAQITATTLEELQKDKVAWQSYLDGLHFMRSKEYQKAINAWEDVLKKYPNSPDTKRNLEQARLRLQSEAGRE